MKNDVVLQTGKRIFRHALSVSKHVNASVQGTEIVLDGGQQIGLTGASMAPDGNIVLREMLIKK